MTEHDHDEDWARELFGDEEDYWPPPPVRGTPPPPRAASGRRVLLRLVSTALVAVAAGTGGALAVKDLTAGSSPSPSAAAEPNAGGSTSPGQSGSGGAVPGGAGSGGAGSGGAVPGGQLPQDASGALEVGGKVTAVSPRSITITAGPQSVTARVTGSTRFSGKVTGISGVRVGDMVFAQISEHNGVDSLVTLQDPYSVS
jgi:hypothetical protein